MSLSRIRRTVQPFPRTASSNASRAWGTLGSTSASEQIQVSRRPRGQILCRQRGPTREQEPAALAKREEQLRHRDLKRGERRGRWCHYAAAGVARSINAHHAERTSRGSTNSSHSSTSSTPST